jgi:hypothetical protein
MAKYKGGMTGINGAQKPNHMESQTGQSGFPESGQHLYS